MPHTSPFSSAMPHAGQPQGPLARDLFAQLRRRFEPMLSLAVAHASADGERDYEKLSGIMAQLCDKEEREPSVLAQNQLEACRLAAYALVDEILLGLPQSGWFAHGLQLQRLGRTDGGNAFYAALFAMLTEALETESRDADILLMHPVYKNPDSSHAPAGLTGLAGHAVHDTRDIAHAMANLADTCNADSHNPALAAASFMALCLLYGFRGCLYAEERARELEDMLSSAARLCARFFPRNEASIQDIPQRAPLPKSLFARLKARLGRPAPIFLVLFPILVTALWYLVCASCINSLDLPWITRS